MAAFITIDGVRKLLEIKESGGKLPEDWEESINNYIKRKRRGVILHKEIFDMVVAELAEAIATYKLLRGG